VPSARSASHTARSVRLVAEFLSDEWIAALHAAALDAPPGNPTADGVLVVEPVVRGVPGRGEVRYRVTCDTVVRAVTAPPDRTRPDVRIETDYPTAVALARGETNAQAALAAGKLRISGDVARLAAHAGALARLGDLFGAVRAGTVYPVP